MSLLSRSISVMLQRLRGDHYPHLRRRVIELNSYHELNKLYGWTQDPLLDDDEIHAVAGLMDLNERRIRDAEVLGTIARNCGGKTFVEIGTAHGHSTALLALNAPAAQVYTVNIPPEEILDGTGGVLTTAAFSREDIGSYYRSRGLANITQIFANTATWQPDLGDIDLAFVDGCHDTEFVYNDTKKMLAHMRPGAFLVWHDFSPTWARLTTHVADVFAGVEKLYADGVLTGYTLLVRDSWMGIYRVE